MTRRLLPLTVVLVSMLVSAAAARAQEPDGAPGPGVAVPLSVEVTISRYRGDELVSSRPYVLAMTAYEHPGPAASLSLGGNVPLLTPMRGPAGAGEPPRTVTYQTTRVAIDCRARHVGEGRYETTVMIDETSVGGENQPSADSFRAPDTPFVREFASDNTLVLRDGESRQYLAAADLVSGETIRVDVTLTVLE